MRTLWALILFGSLIIHHCFTNVSGEVVKEKESQPSYSDCKPYVDAALKGETPSPPQEDLKQPVPPGGDEKSDKNDKNDDDESDEDEDGNVAHKTTNDSSDSDEDEEESQIKTTTKDVDDGSSEEDEETPEPGVEEIDDDEEPSSKQGEKEAEKKAEESEESKEQDEKAGRGATGANSTPPPPQPNNGASSNSVADDSDESSEDKNNEPEPVKEAKISKPTSEAPKPISSKSKEPEPVKEVKNPKVAPKPVSSEEDKDDDDESEEKEEKKVVKDKKTQKTVKKPEVKEDDDEDDDSEEEEKVIVAKPKVKKTAKKVEIVEEDDDDSEEENEPEVRSRDHLIRILGLDESSDFQQKNSFLDKVTLQTLKELKNTYEYSIKPLETLYKYRDLSNRHFGDPEIFSKPMIVFMGPWSGGKSTIINWLLGIKDNEHALRTGADPSPAQFNIMTHGTEEEVLDGTQLAADWTFSGLQKFGQSFLDRLRGRKLPNKLLEKVNLVEIPGILEIRKQVQRSFPFNDACQWFIDRADVLFLVYDPAKLDIGPETEAILDQLKGRESQVRIVLNKADSVKPDELLRVQATLVWNISPLMSSAEPPVLYAASLWERPLQPDSPKSLLNAHENLFLKDISEATQKRVETRIAAARRFAVRVRNHAKMCDCYLNTYNNHRSFFSNKKRISDDIIEHPQNYHIYEGLSTLTNISRYDLPDPDTYRDFFRLNPVWEFPTLASTCTYFRGCPINKLDIAIAYDLPELLGRYRRQRESILSAPTGTLPDIKLKEIKKEEAPLDIPKGKSKWYKLPPGEGEKTDEKTVEEPKKSPQLKESNKAAESSKDKKDDKKDESQEKQGKNKWWKEVKEEAKKVETEPILKAEKVEGKKSKDPSKELGPPPPGYRLVIPKNHWYAPYYEKIEKEKKVEENKGKKRWYKNAET